MPYFPGDYWMICDICGFKKRKSQMRKDWQGLMVCEKDFEMRHPQDFVKSRVEKTSVPIARPEATDRFLTASITSVDDIENPTTTEG